MARAHTHTASLSDIGSAIGERTAWSPRPADVNPAIARMHERLRAARAPGERGPLPVPSTVACGRSSRSSRARIVDGQTLDGRTEALDAMDGGAGTARITRSTVAAQAPAHLARSAERFVRLQGRSGRAYVFSRIEPRHVSLYRNGVFATAPQGAERASVVGDVAPILSNAIADDLLYVHLLSETDGDRAAVVADLT